MANASIGIMHKTFGVKIPCVVREICSWTDRQTDTHTDALITIHHHCSCGRSKYPIAVWLAVSSS